MRLLAIEDEPALAGLLRDALARAGFAVDHANGVGAAEDCLAAAEYDAVILDLGLADGDGLDLLAAMRRRRSSVPVLILTARGTPEDRVAGLDRGADDYLVKPFHMNELIARVRALLRRPNAVLGVVLELDNLRLDTVGRTVSVDGADIVLTPRETSLLTLLLRRHGQVVVREAIEAGLYGFDEPTGPNALEVLVHRLRKRLGEAGAGVAIHTVRGVGYLLGRA